MKSHSFFAVIFLVIIVGLACNYYKPLIRDASNVSDRNRMMDSLKQRTFILHSPSGNFLVTNMEINAGAQTVIMTLGEVPPEHSLYLNDVKKKFRYHKKEIAVLEEVHVYTGLAQGVEKGADLTLSVKDVKKLEIIQRDKARSTSNTILAIAGITVGSLAVMAVIVAATKSSCPFISTYDGNQYVLQGETFGGAIYPSLARHDIVPLPATAVGPEIKICIHNELHEYQFTDFANLWVIEHRDGQRVVSTPGGDLLLVKNQAAPLSAVLNGRKDVVQDISQTDQIPCAFNDTTDASGLNRLLVQFPQLENNKDLSLILNIRNSHWLEYIMGNFMSHFGAGYPKWIAQQKEKPADQMLQWQENQHLPLSMMVKTKTGWKDLPNLKTIGPLMDREVAISLKGLDLPAGPVEIMFSAGFMFWEMDQVMLANTEPVSPLAIQDLTPNAAVDAEGHNLLGQLKSADNTYLEQPNIGDRAYLSYLVKDFSKTKQYSVFLHTKGYYEPIRNYEGKADLMFLNRFRDPGYFTVFSLEQYKGITNSNHLAAQ